jgi:hypothetical protein
MRILFPDRRFALSGAATAAVRQGRLGERRPSLPLANGQSLSRELATSESGIQPGDDNQAGRS